MLLTPTALHSFAASSLHSAVWESGIKKKQQQTTNVIDLLFKSEVRYMSPCLLIHLDNDFFFLITNARAWA